MQNYEIKLKYFVKKGSFNYTFSFSWDVKIPGIKEESYELKPLSGTQFNIAYFELLAEPLNSKNERFGYCFVESIYGARNELQLSQQIGILMKKKNDS